MSRAVDKIGGCSRVGVSLFDEEEKTTEGRRSERALVVCVLYKLRHPSCEMRSCGLGMGMRMELHVQLKSLYILLNHIHLSISQH